MERKGDSEAEEAQRWGQRKCLCAPGGIGSILELCLKKGGQGVADPVKIYGVLSRGEERRDWGDDLDGGRWAGDHPLAG